VSKDNLGVPYSPDNVPYQPKSFLKISLDGVKEGDFSFIMGYPGTTQRNYTCSEFSSDIEAMKERVDTYTKILEFLENASKDDRGIRIKYASALYGFSNGLKNRTAKLEGFQKHSIMEKKEALEKKFMEWVAQLPDTAVDKKKYGNILKEIEDFMQKNKAVYQAKQVMEDLVDGRNSPALPTQAFLVYRTAVERQKPDMQRDIDFQDRELQGIQVKIETAERSFHLDTDKAYFKLLLKLLENRDKSTWPRTLLPVLEKGPEEIDKYVDELYASTKLTNPQKRLELIKSNPGSLLKPEDPFINLAAGLEKEFKVLRDRLHIIDQQREDLKKVYLAAMLEMNRGRIAPEANSSIRFSYGPVKGYRPRDGVIYLAQTTLKGLMEKDAGAYPFEVPGKIKELYRARDFGRYIDENLGDIPACFINTTNVTGGSSGSPALNANGEIIGLVFDMVYEGVTGDYFIVPEVQRVICVDIRFVLFVTDKFSGARHLLEEIGAAAQEP
jgi:hypothetical protein